ncbi:hypothetical protein KAH27_04460 [bacterium]|nr:hypothetical protein [bacterium]
MRSLRISYAGTRGIIGESMTPVLAQRYVNALGAYLEGAPVVIARDPRVSGIMLHSAAISALLSCGCDIYDLGICPTPVAQLYIRNHDNIKGGIVITGGHNNANWNGIIPYRADGTVFDEYDGGELLEFYHAVTFPRVGWKKLGKHIIVDNATEIYLEKLIYFLDTEKIKAKNLTVVLDACNGAAAPLSTLICQKLNCNVIPINDEPNGIFPHAPEPRPRNGKQVSSIIKAIGADVGFCFNSDGSRFSIVSNDGETISEEFALPIIADYYLSKKCSSNSIVTNICTTKTLDDVSKKHSARLIKTSIGQSAVISTMLNEDACIGGEGSGGIAIRKFQPAFDAFLSMGLVLSSLTESGKSCKELINNLSRYHLVKKYVCCRPDRQYTAVDEVRRAFENERNIDLTDGVRIDWEDGWLHVRAATTEPMVRVISESKTKELSAKRVDSALKIIYSVI